VNGPLDGLKVLDLSRFIAGPYCGMLLGDLGAEVVKVEKAGRGDDTRQLPPRIAGDSLYVMIFNRNKRSLSLNYRDPRGQELLRELACEADVLIENFRAGTMEKMGCGWEELHALNPRLIMARVSGFGQDGPYAERACFDVIAQATSGLMDITGRPDGPPTVIGTFIVDYTTALNATVGVLAALAARHENGRGQLVDVALLDSAVSLLLTAIPEQILLNKTMARLGNRDRYAAPGNTFQTRDGAWVHFVPANDHHFERFVRSIDLAHLLDDPRFENVRARMEHVDEIEAIVAAWAREKDAEEVVALMDELGVPCAKVATIADVVNDPQLRHRNQIIEVDHPDAGKIPMQGQAIKLSETPASIRLGVPTVGQHNADVLGDWLGYDSERVGALAEEGII